MTQRARFWLTYLPLIILWYLVEISHHYNLWWYVLGICVIYWFSTWSSR